MPNLFLPRLMLVAAVMTASALPASAVDSVPKKDTPDLTTVRASIKAKEFATDRDALLKLADIHQQADVYNLLGFSLRKLGDYKMALTYYTKELELEPEHKGAHEYLGELYVGTKQPDKARQHLAVLVRLCPQGCERREELEKAMTAAGIQ